MKKTLTRILLIGLCLVSSLSQAWAASDGAISLTWENDAFTGTDNNYTNGVGFTWVSGAIDTDNDGLVEQWTDLWSFLPFVADSEYQTYASWSVVQEMNTPDDDTIPNPSEDDQPFSGILYIDSTLYAQKEDWMHLWQLKLGVVGPMSHAEDVQRGFHKVIGANKPHGWDTQLPNEAVVNLTYTVAHLVAAGSVGDSAQWRLVPIGTLGLGNYFTGAGAGVYGEVGWNLVDALGVSALRSGFNVASTVGVKPLAEWSFSFFGGIGAYGVAHYLPLDGTLFRDSRSVDSNPLIGMVSAGFCLRRGTFSLSYSNTFFSETFETERHKTDFGTLGMSWTF
ncbi:lipid A deacylase LpxR family protein [Shewanella profunda]|jgi:hypothetical protein|uniref:lipid A deacylase LpxR family protein n=1 Tax=Shewanella profunda TaxID=254793 RepID=UPI00200C1997|nr:lipid A deacylase LpxR family protein [Shewanella profunda]MCL1089111.1 lipid A deacylase LpxR family protein [Shewanella profunda]